MMLISPLSFEILYIVFVGRTLRYISRMRQSLSANNAQFFFFCSQILSQNFLNQECKRSWRN
jgi:hypothetical protein